MRRLKKHALFDLFLNRDLCQLAQKPLLFLLASFLTGIHAWASWGKTNSLKQSTPRSLTEKPRFLLLTFRPGKTALQKLNWSLSKIPPQTAL